MAARLFGKKDPGDADSPETPGGDSPSELEQLTGQLGKLGELLAQANHEIAAYLARRESQEAAVEARERAAHGLSQQIAALAEKIDKLTPFSTGATPVPPAGAAESAPAGQDLRKLLGHFEEKLGRVEAGVKTLCESSVAQTQRDDAEKASILDSVRQLQAKLDGGLQRLAELLTPPEETDEDEKAAAGSVHWEWAILGSDLAQRPELAFQRQQLINGVLEGNSGACALAGQLLVFQSAPAERLPQLLKDIGEAFYRWHPKTTSGTNAMENALVQWLKRSCESAGIYNTIALVHPGERFDAARHTASSRGVEITEVHGWIVLRDNGKVYTKATVTVQ